MKKTIIFTCFISIFLLMACDQNNHQSQNQNNTPHSKNTNMKETYSDLKEKLASQDIHVEKTSYQFDGKTYLADFYYQTKEVGKRPSIIVVPEWWGLNDYTKTRAKMLAGLGFAAMAIDVFGNGETGQNPAEAMALTKPYNSDPSLSKKIIDAALQKLKTFSQVDTSKIGIIGYCFGGFVAINAGVLGADVKAVVGFHPSLGGIHPEKNIKAKFLICHGTDDEFEKANVEPFKKAMDSAGIDYTFKDYSGAKHAFTSPKADESGKQFGIPIAYNAAADSASWDDMKSFLQSALH